MSALQAIQQQMLQAVLAEKTLPARTIRSDDIADADNRLDVYRHGYRIRLRDALKTEFTGLQCIAGQRFDALLDKYIDAHPSEHYNIRWYGSGVAAFLNYARPWRDKPQLAEMARLDWAISTAFDAADEPSVGMAELSSLSPDAWANLHLLLQENLQLLANFYNTDAFRRAADSNAKRPRLHRFAQANQVMVWRKATTVHYRKLDHDEWRVLTAAMHGEPFAALCAALTQYHDESAAMSRMVSLLQGWLEAGLIRGLAVN
jgi:Putative DNA-binding domain